MKTLKILFIILFVPSLLFASGPGVAFLKITPGAEPAAMGGAHTALRGNISALYYNPAGIASISQTQIGASHTEWIAGMKYNFAGGTFRAGGGALGVSATLLSVGEMEGRGEDREKADDFTASDFALQASYGRDLNPQLAGGLSVKIISQRIANESALGFAIDTGLQRELSNTVIAAATVRNLGPSMKFISETYNLPLTLSLGMGVRVGGVTLAADADYGVFDGSVNMSLGTQWMPVQFLTLRGGYLMKLAEETSGMTGTGSSGLDGLGAGVGINILSYTLNYAFVPYGDLGDTQRISFTGKF